MLLEHRGKVPRIHPTAYVAPTATVCGDVTIGEASRVLFGAVIVAEGGPVVIGAHCIVMEHAVVRGTAQHPARIGDHVLVGPHAHLSGCTVEDSVFVATGAAVFNGARLGTRSEVRIHGVVHLRSVLPPDAVVPIGWVAATPSRSCRRTSTTGSGRSSGRSTSRGRCSASNGRRWAKRSCRS